MLLYLTKEEKDAWIKALRSGDYNQGKEFIHNSDTNCYCCLGVLCKLQNIEYRPITNEEKENGISDDDINNKAYIEIKERVPAYHLLVKMNDEQNCSFNEIADYIETTTTN